MNRYIDFEIAREYLHKACECIGGNGGMMLKIKFDEEQKADVVEVVYGKWIDKGHDNIYECSKCGDMWMGVGGYNYCPNCGARNRGGR